MYKILLVDDEALEREALKIIIEESFSNAKVVGEARFGRESIELNEELNPDIILMDIKMPGINGIEATKIIKDKNKDKYIIILTAYDEFAFAQNAIKAGANDYLLKPARPEEVVAAIEKCIKEIEKDLLIEEEGSKNNTVELEDKCNSREIQRVLEYIAENVTNNISLEEAAKVANMSSFYLSKLFKKEMGINFVTYISMQKIQEAKKWLLDTDEPIGNIAMELGYNEPNYFSKVFKRIEGMTPTTYRQKNR